MESPVAVTGYALLSASLVISTILGLLVLWFHLRRSFPPIKSRFWWQSELNAANLIIWSLYRCVSLEFPGLGLVFYILSYPLFFNIWLCALIRLAHIYSAYKLADLYTNLTSSQNTIDLNSKLSQGGFFIKYARYVQDTSAQGLVIFAHMMIHLVIWIAVALTVEKFTNEQELIILALTLSVYGLPIVYLAWKIIPLKDGLYLRQEIVYMFYALVSGGALFILLAIVADLYYVNVTVALVGPVEFVAIYIGFPLFKSYAWQNEARRFERMEGHAGSSCSQKGWSGSSCDRASRAKGKSSRRKIQALEYSHARKKGCASVAQMSLKEVLDSPQGVDAFKEFCKQELNHESILFFLDAKALCEAMEKSSMTEEEVASRARSLYERYIKQGALLEINIGASAKESFRTAGICGDDTSKLDFALLEDAFKDARDEVFRLMASDSFVRFLRHRLYTEFVKNKKGPSIQSKARSFFVHKG